MSYFFGTNGVSGSIKTGRRKHSRHRSLSDDKLVEQIHGSMHRKRHATSNKSVLKPKCLSKECSNTNCDGHNSSTKSKSKHCLHKEITRLVEENKWLSSKLEGTEIDIGDLSSFKEKDELISKLKKKYKKLEQSYNEMQIDRDNINLLIAQRESEVRQMQMHNEESTLIIRNFEQERNNFIAMIQKLKSENLQLNEDVNLLKNLIYRLNVEIEKYQDKLRLSDQTTENQTFANIIDNDVDLENKSVLKTWGKVNFHALGPLLDAYEENINEKNDLLQKYKKELDSFTGRVKDIIEENENLHTAIENLKLKYDRYIEENKTIEKDASIIKEQNDLLNKQASLQKHKMQEIHSVYEQKVESMSQDNNKLHKEYLVCKTELSNLRGKYEILNEGYEKIKSNSEKTMPVSVHNTAIEECKRLFEELKCQYECEKKKLNSRIKLYEETQPENEKQLINVTAERDQLRIQVKNLEKNLKRIQHKWEHLQTVVHSIQTSRDSFKRQLNKTTSYCEDLVKEQETLIAEKNKLSHLLEEREKENENIQYLGNNIAQRMGTLKNQLKIVQEGAKEQLASVEKHIKDQELGVDQMKTEFQRELQRLKQLLREKDEFIQNLQREKCATQDNLELVWKAATCDKKKVKDPFKSTSIFKNT